MPTRSVNSFPGRHYGWTQLRPIPVPWTETRGIVAGNGNTMASEPDGAPNQPPGLTKQRRV
jgi:hypothetical protein